MAIPRILVVEDDPEMRQMLTQFLQQNGSIALPASGVNEIQKHMAAGRVDLILLDVMLGAESGIEICRALRQETDVPIIMVSALSTDQQRMAGYAAGADDYIAKPFNAELVLARIKAVQARSRRSASLAHRRRVERFSFGGWSYDARSDEVMSPAGVQITLSRREIGLLQALLANPHIPLTRDELVAAMDITGAGEDMDTSGRAIDVLVGRLRSKIETNPKKPEMLRTQRGVGYVFAVDVTTSDA